MSKVFLLTFAKRYAILHLLLNAELAQLAERDFYTVEVVSSILTFRTV